MELIEAYQMSLRKKYTISASMRWNEFKNCYEWDESPKPKDLIGEYKKRYLTPLSFAA